MAKLKAAIAAAALAGGLAVAGSALAQAGITPPDWQILLRCAEIGDGDQRLACYDQAMRAAGYAPKPEVVAEEKRKRFGLSVPKLNILKHDDQKRTEVAGQAAPAPAASAPPPPPPKEDDDTVTVQLERVAVLYGNKLLLITTEGRDLGADQLGGHQHPAQARPDHHHPAHALPRLFLRPEQVEHHPLRAHPLGPLAA